MLFRGSWIPDDLIESSEVLKKQISIETRKYSIPINVSKKQSQNISHSYIKNPDRYHLIVALSCPWATRALMALKMKGLDRYISYSIVDPIKTEQGWALQNGPKPWLTACNDFIKLHEIYHISDALFTGRASVPVFWDIVNQEIVINESSDLLIVFDSLFPSMADNLIVLFPEDKIIDINKFDDELQLKFVGAIYRAAEARIQAEYDAAISDIFLFLDKLDVMLDTNLFVLGDRLTASDLKVFSFLIRFDLVYYNLYRCNLRRVSDYSNIASYLQRMLTIDAIRSTVSLDHIKKSYFYNSKTNPHFIIPAGPDISYIESMLID